MAAEACTVCQRGPEACQYCENLPVSDWEAICDCGLHDFGAHITTCEDRFAYRYVIAADYETAYLPRTHGG